MKTNRWRPKTVLVAVGAAIGAIAGFALFLSLFLPINLGLPFGYYGEWNQTLAEFRKLPEVEIIHEGANLDATLEEMWFDVAYDKRTELDIFIPQTMRSDELFHSFDGIYLKDIERFVRPEDFEKILGRRISNLAEFLRESPYVLRQRDAFAERVGDSDYDVHRERFCIIYNLREYGAPDPWAEFSSRRYRLNR